MNLRLFYKSYLYTCFVVKFNLKFYFPFLLFFISIVGCEQLPFKYPLSGPFPYELKVVKTNIPTNTYLFDLNNDGREEFIQIGDDGSNDIRNACVKISNSEGVFIDQENVTGKILKVFPIDWDEDGNIDVAIPFVRNDSLFIVIVDYQCNKIFDRYLYSGEPRIDGNSTYEWKGGINNIFLKDINNDDKNELLIFANEGKARSPRGVIIFNKNTFQIIDKYEIGPRFNDDPIFADFDNDGYVELLFGTSAADNGNIANSTDDKSSYLMLIDFDEKSLKFEKFGGTFTAVFPILVDINNDGKKEIVTYLYSWGDSDFKARFYIINPGTLKPIGDLRSFAYDESNMCIGQFDRDVQQEFILCDKQGNLALVDQNFDILKTKKINLNMSTPYTCPDMDGDGIDELLIYHTTGTYIFDNKLNPIAKSSEYFLTRRGMQIYHRYGDTPLITLYNDANGVLVELKRNPYFIIQFYGPYFILLCIVTIFIGSLIMAISNKSKAKYYDTLFKNYLKNFTHPTFILNHKLQIIETNFLALKLLNLDQSKLPLSLISANNIKTELCETINVLKKFESVNQEINIQIEEKTNESFQFIAEPIKKAGNNKQHWIVTLKSNEVANDAQKSQNWAAMAQRIAHDIKNPLTSILLSLQRLQMEYRDKDKKNIDNYDQYTNRIIERIEFLRRQSRDFMKFVNLEHINLQPTDLNKLIKNIFIDAIIEIPTDILLEKKLSPVLPTIHLDQEQVQTVIENLVTNAINALPDGGKITISTSLAPDLQLCNGSEKVSDYIIMEVMDTGVGIPEKMKDKLFLPFSTNTHLGTGLGLMIVKKIINDHRGFIEVNSEQGFGTSFSVYLPVA
jgi:nitrogen-specific signal transduction histidine kinase